MARNVLADIYSMKGALGSSASSVDFAELEDNAMALLTRIEKLIVEGKVRPRTAIRHSVEDATIPKEDRELRIGIFPTAANPLHWAHLLGGLTAMERFHLDKVIFVIAGWDSRKPGLAPENLRHSMAKKVLDLFHPLFEYSSIALGTTKTGEENFFRILGMNHSQAIHGFYITGGDHYHRLHPVTGKPDTIQKLEDALTSNMHGFDVRAHRISAVFLRREGEEVEIPTFLDVHRLGEVPLQTCSTAIRQALGDRRCWRKLFTLPFEALVAIRADRLYSVSPSGAALRDVRGALPGMSDREQPLLYQSPI